MTLRDAAELFKTYGNISIKWSDVNGFREVLNILKIKYDIEPSDEPDMVRFVKK